MKVRVVSVTALEVFDAQGGSLGLFLVADQWQGLQRLLSVDGKTEIIIHGETAFPGAFFSRIFGEQRGDCQVIKITPELAVKLKEAANAAGVSA